MITELDAKQWIRLKVYCRGTTRRELEQRNHLPRVLAGVANMGAVGGVRLSNEGLSDALVAEALRYCSDVAPVHLEAELGAGETGDGA